MSTTTPASIPTTGTWNIEGVHSTANISVAHNVVSTFRAQFLGLTGTLENGVLSGSLPVESLHLGLPIFREHVLSEGFLDAANHPTLSFRSSEIHAHSDGTVHLTGEITIKGVTKPIAASGTVTGPLEVTRADGQVSEFLGLALTTTVDRREFGLEIASGTGWDVTIDVNLELIKA
jgi:polyisoprenoid-binding protein YceI